MMMMIKSTHNTYSGASCGVRRHRQLFQCGGQQRQLNFVWNRGSASHHAGRASRSSGWEPGVRVVARIQIARGRRRSGGRRRTAVVDEVAAGAVRTEARGVVGAAQLRLVLGVTLQRAQFVRAVRELAAVAVAAQTALLVGAAQLRLVAARVGRHRRHRGRRRRRRPRSLGGRRRRRVGPVTPVRRTQSRQELQRRLGGRGTRHRVATGCRRHGRLLRTQLLIQQCQRQIKLRLQGRR